MAKSIVAFWESIEDKKGAKERADRVLKPIYKYNKKARKVLELGVGIGAVLNNFPKRFDIYGLDIKKEYIEVCRKKIKRGEFFVSSMHNFKIDESFDAIFSVFDSINFLETFSQWKSTFTCVSEHLNENSLFIFDMYTPKALNDFKGKEATARKFSKGYYFDGAIIKANALTWDFKIFEKITDDTYQFMNTILKKESTQFPK